MKTSVFSLKLRLEFSSFKREANGSIGREENKKCKKKKGSDDHLVVALSQKDRLLICNQTKAASSVLAKLLQLRRGAKSKSCRGGKESRQEAAESSATRRPSPGSGTRCGCRTLRRPLLEQTRFVAGRPATDRQRLVPVCDKWTRSHLLLCVFHSGISGQYVLSTSANDQLYAPH